MFLLFLGELIRPNHSLERTPPQAPNAFEARSRPNGLLVYDESGAAPRQNLRDVPPRQDLRDVPQLTAVMLLSVKIQ
jgi:hypothetical protein